MIFSDGSQLGRHKILIHILAVFGAEHINFDSCIFKFYRLLSLFGLTGMTLEIIFQILVRFRYLEAEWDP